MSFAPGFRTGPFLPGNRRLPPPTPTTYSYSYLLIAGGDSSLPAYLVRAGQLTIQWQANSNGELRIVGSPIWGIIYGQYANVGAALIAACTAAGPGKSVVGFSNPPFYQQLTIIFDATVSPRVWYCANVQAQPQVWTPATGLPAGNGIDMAQGPFAESAVAVFAGPASRYSPTGVAFGVNGTPPSQINRVILEPGQAGIYLGAAAGGIVKSIDFGLTWGYVRPHATLGTAWPAGAVGRDVCILPAAAPVPALAPLIVLGTNVYKKLGEENIWAAIDGVPPNSAGQMLRYYGSGKMTHMTKREGAVRYSGDTGATWATRSVPSPVEDFDSCEIAPSGRMWALGKKVTGSPDVGYIYYSDDFGATWNASTNWTINLDVCQISVNQGNSNQIAASYLSGGSGDVAVRVSSNGGASWANHTLDTTATLNPAGASGRMHWLGTRLIILYELTSSFIKIQYSDNNGSSWTNPLSINSGSSAEHVHDFITGGPLGPLFAAISKVATTVTGCMLRSTDHGASWEQLNSPFSGAVSVRALAYDALTDRLFAGASDGTIKVLTGASTVLAANWVAGFTDVTPSGITAPGHGQWMVLATN